MNWKGALLVGVLLFALLIAYAALAPPKTEVKAPEPYGPMRFTAYVQEEGIVDSSNGERTGARAYSTILLDGNNTFQANMTMLWLNKKPKTNIYSVTNYQRSALQDKMEAELEQELAPYGMGIEKVTLDEVMNKKDSVILLFSNALPSELTGGGLAELSNENLVIYSGLPFTVSTSLIGMQEEQNTSVYNTLNVTLDKSGKITSRIGSPGPDLVDGSGYQMLRYDEGALVVFPAPAGSTGNAAEVMVDIIIHDSWQEPVASDSFSQNLSTEARRDFKFTETYFSSESKESGAYMRLILEAAGPNESVRRIFDRAGLEKMEGQLQIPSTVRRNADLAYRFELSENSTYPKQYQFALAFYRDGTHVDEKDLGYMMIQTIGVGEDKVTQNLSPGDYVVRLEDQGGQAHAQAYLHIPDVKVRLASIMDDTYTFTVRVDGEPAPPTKGSITVDGGRAHTFNVDKKGEARLPILLGPGRHEFLIEMDEEQYIVAYSVKSDDQYFMLYASVVLGPLLLIGGYFLRQGGVRKWGIVSHPRHDGGSTTMTIENDDFLKIFTTIQKERAAGMPLNVSDLRIGFRRFVTNEGRPVFLTDSNIYRLLESEARKGRFVAYEDYFMPASQMDGKPIEYWAVKRMITDFFIENGIDYSKHAKADLSFDSGKKILHIYNNVDMKIVAQLAKNADNYIIFPDRKSLTAFRDKLMEYDKSSMGVYLQLLYGRVFCYTVNDFITSVGRMT